MRSRNFQSRVRKLEQAAGIGKPRGRVTLNRCDEDGSVIESSTGEPGPFPDTIINIRPVGPHTLTNPGIHSIS